MTTVTPDLDRLAIDTIRTLSIDGVQQANSGHPGAPMGAAPMAYVLWTRFLRHAPTHPDWPDRDRFVLSAGHASMLLYSLLHLTGYDLSLDELKQMKSQTVSREITLECAGNGRVFLVPQARGLQWGNGAVGNAKWTGVPLGAILERAKVKTGAVDVVLMGADKGSIAEPATPGAIGAMAWMGFAYVALFSMWIGFFAWYRALALGAVRVSQIQLVQPFLSLLFAVPLLGERLDLVTAVFALAVIATVFVGKKMPVHQGAPA